MTDFPHQHTTFSKVARDGAGGKINVHHIRVVRETAKAWLIDTEEAGEIWVPQSKCELMDENTTIRLPKWLAKDKGLI